MMKRALLSVVVVVVAGVVALSGCPPAAGTGADAGMTTPTPTTTTPTGKEDRTVRSEIKANYDANTPPDPRATAVCDAIYTVPAQKRSACCKEPEAKSPLASTCAGVLTAALLTKDIVLDDAKAKACADARTAALDGCGWVSNLSPRLPEVCGQIVSGSLSSSARCRSSLECNPGLRCNGSSPLDPGRCGDPSPIGGPCGASVDALAVVVQEPAIEALHPQCADGGFCTLGRCLAQKKLGEPCRSNAECGAKNACVDDKCVAGRVATGGACKKAECVDGNRCHSGVCEPLAAENGACFDDFDCLRGACNKAKGAAKDAKGVCGMRCTMF